MQKFLRLEFIDSSADVGLFVLRLWLGGSMLWLHGWGKLLNLFHGKLSFGDPLGLGSTPSFLLVIFAEVVCSLLLVLGWAARWAALVLGFTMGVAFFAAHKMDFKAGELAWVYLGGCVVLFCAGPGRFSLDKK